MLRDALKTISFAVLHFSVGFGVTYALTGSIAIASGVALIEPAVNTVVFFLHERAWQISDRLRIWHCRRPGEQVSPDLDCTDVPAQIVRTPSFPDDMRTVQMV